VNKDFLF